jgi:hypothetical protein
MPRRTSIHAAQINCVDIDLIRTDRVPNALTTNTLDETNTFTILLNDRWRVVDDPLQWMLQYQAGNVSAEAKSSKFDGWVGKHFCRTRDALLRDIKENCSGIDPAVIATLKSLPDWHPEQGRSS